MKPPCIWCGEQPARKLKQLGNYPFYCSLACAAHEGIAGHLAVCDFWCSDHQCWSDDGECYECERQALEHMEAQHENR
jgi:hypothetical protein